MRLLAPLLGGLVASLSSASAAVQDFAHDSAAQDIQHPLDNFRAKKLDLTHDLVGFHKNLSSISSISGHELEVGDWLAASLESQGYTVEQQEVEAERFNILAWPGSKRNPRLLLTSHIDVVPPYLPYATHTNKSGTYISGRGTVDAKGSVAAMIIAAHALLASNEITPNDYSLLFVVGEEVGGAGMRAANKLRLAPKRIIFGEPTDRRLASGHKGMLHLTLRAKGQAAHSGYPWLGRSANEVLVAALGALMDLQAALPADEHFGATTFNIGTVAGGVAANVVAERAEAVVAVRIAGGTPETMAEAMRAAVHNATARFKKAEDDEVVELVFAEGAYGPVAIDADVPGFDSEVVNYGTDIPSFNVTAKGAKRYLYGPGSIFVAHSDHEGLMLAELEGAVKDYKKLILHCLQT